LFSDSLPAVTLTSDLWPQKLISTSTKLNTSVTKIGQNCLHCFLRYGVHKVFGMHRLTHSRTDAQTQMQYVSGTVFQWLRKHKNMGWCCGAIGRASDVRFTGCGCESWLGTIA